MGEIVWGPDCTVKDKDSMLRKSESLEASG